MKHAFTSITSIFRLMDILPTYVSNNSNIIGPNIAKNLCNIPSFSARFQKNIKHPD